MKKTFQTLLLGLFLLGVAAPEARAVVAPDTLTFKSKVRYGGEKVKGNKAFKAILEKAGDAEVMRRFQSFKTMNLTGSVVGFVGLMVLLFASFGLGVLLMVGGIVVSFASRGRLKKVVRRFNDVVMGRAPAEAG